MPSLGWQGKKMVLFVPPGTTITETLAATTWKPCGWSPSPSCPSVTETWSLTLTVAAASASSLGSWWDRGGEFDPREVQSHQTLNTGFSPGGGMHGPGGGSGGQEAGVDPSWEARPQLHDGFSHLQEGEHWQLQLQQNYCFSCQNWHILHISHLTTWTFYI